MCSSRLLPTLLPALLLAAACTETPPSAAPEWDALVNVPEGFADGTDDTRTDEEIRAAVDGLFVTAEVDPAFAASPLAAVTQEHVAGWNAAAQAGDHRAAGYLTEESDPAFAASPAANITSDGIAQWNVAAGWGDHAQAGYLVGEVDPLFAASPLSAVTEEQVEGWDAAAEAGDHRAVGYLTEEVDPSFAASPAAGITAAGIAQWNAAAGWGNHAQAGYLTAEADPSFAASPAAGITSAGIAQWNAAAGWGNHATKGYLTAEADPKIDTLTSGAIPRWNGTKLSNGSITDVNGKVGVGTAPGAGALTVTNVAQFGIAMGDSTVTKSCGTPGLDWTHTPPSAGACNTWCQSQGLHSGRLAAVGSRPAGGARCVYVSDFETCATATMGNSGCDSKATSFLCTCRKGGTSLAGDLRLEDGYVQLDTVTGAPPAEDCNDASERGRMVTDPVTGDLWVCANSGWIAK